MKTETIKICKLCDTKFVSIRSNHLCCSPKCSSKYYQKRRDEEVKMGYSEEPYTPVEMGGEHNRIEYHFLNPTEQGIVEPTTEQFNEFHELTEKELRIKKGNYLSKDIDNLIVLINEKFDAVNLKIEQNQNQLFQQNVMIANNLNLRYDNIEKMLQLLLQKLEKIPKKKKWFFG